VCVVRSFIAISLPPGGPQETAARPLRGLRQSGRGFVEPHNERCREAERVLRAGIDLADPVGGAGDGPQL